MSTIGKQVQQSAINVLGKFYNKLNTKETKRTILVGGCSYHILGTEYKSKKIDKEDNIVMFVYDNKKIFEKSKAFRVSI
jgi:hypothetical protein